MNLLLISFAIMGDILVILSTTVPYIQHIENVEFFLLPFTLFSFHNITLQCWQTHVGSQIV